MSFESRIKKHSQKLENDEQVKGQLNMAAEEEARNLKAAVDESRELKAIEIQKDPRFLEIKGIADSSRLREALDAYSKEFGNDLPPEERTKVIRDMLFGRDKKIITKIPGIKNERTINVSANLIP